MDKEVMDMQGWRLYISAFVFVGVTVLKLLFPAYTEELRSTVRAVIDMDMDYTEELQTIGALLTEEAVQEVINGICLPSGVGTVEAVDEVVMPTVQCIVPSPSPELLLEEPSLDTMQKAVEAFMAAQEAYAAYEVPVTVTYNAVAVPFAYAEPVAGVCSSGFGYRVHPIENEVLFHYGTDYDVEEGTAVAAFADGTVTFVGEEPGYGKYVQITHADGWKSLYAHCSDVSVSLTDEIAMGDVIALSGQTGRVTGPHLHFELTHEGMYTNPEFYFYDGNE